MTQRANSRDARQGADGAAARNAQASSPQPAAGFAPAKISILPLTEFSGLSAAGPNATLSVYVALLDAFGSQIKAPAVLRFELYSHIPRSGEPKGQRIAVWPDIDLTRPADNHKYWQDFLRAYEFDFDLQVDRTRTCILEVTCMSCDGRRLSAEHTLKGTQP